MGTLPASYHAVGLDLATRVSGLFEATDDKLLGGRIIKAGDWLEMQRNVKAVLAEIKPDMVAIEGTFMGKDAEVHALLNMLAGSVIGWCDDNEVRWYRGKTAQIDARCGIPGRLRRPARKQATRAFARQVGFEVPQDVADALCVLWWGMGERTRDRMVEGEEWK